MALGGSSEWSWPEALNGTGRHDFRDEYSRGALYLRPRNHDDDHRSPPDSIVLLAFPELATPSDEETALGFAQLYPSLSSRSLGPVTILNDLYVSPTGRRAGVARRLVEEAAAYARRTGAIRLELVTQHTNLPALGLYRSLGFEPETEFAHVSLELDR